jgi:hypothetical protein
MPMADKLLETARRFAAALDCGDYAAARAELADHCVYLISDATTVIGADAIIASFQAKDEAARRRWHEIDYGSHVERTGPASALVHFTDRVRHGRAWHAYRCRQYLQIGDSGLIESILFEELPGERAALHKFAKDHGIPFTD